ncbi:MAG: T9SS type A sorting domain-containing protein [Bacteroidota bacterium]|jgi:regulation of enolase protein 1 (concanavalin A-like superfamily)|nr:T9SS type A sorting domain-containing protein [Bacteroidota bacterium]
MKSICLTTLLLLLGISSLQAQFSDEFNAAALDAGWRWERESPANWQLGDDAVTIWTETGALNGTGFNNVRNILLQPLSSDEDFRMDTELRFLPYWTLRNAGVIYYIDDDHYIRVSRGINDGHDDIWMEWEVDGQTQFRYAAAAIGNSEKPCTEFRLRLTRRAGSAFSASYCIRSDSAGWSSWHSFATEIINYGAAPVHIGLQAANGEGMMATAVPAPALFQYFHYNTGTSVTSPDQAPVGMAATPAYPTPARIGTTLGMTVTINRAAVFGWRLVDILGRDVIAPQQLGRVTQGEHRISLPTVALPPGIYLWQISAGRSQVTQRIVLTR